MDSLFEYTKSIASSKAFEPLDYEDIKGIEASIPGPS